MAIEYCRPTSYTASAGLTNGANAYDADVSTSATLTSTATTTRTATSSGFSSKTQTWTSASLNIKYNIVTQGDGGATQWDSIGNMWYSLDGGGTWTQTSLSNPSFTGDNSGTVGPWSDSISISISSNPTQVLVRMDATGHAKTGIIPNIILGSSSTCDLYEAWIEGTYSTAPTVTSLNSGSLCNIGSSYNIVGTNFTGATTVTINSVSASFSVTNSTTISVTIPPMSISGSNITSCAVAVTTSAGTGTANVGNITLPSVSYSPTPASITQNTTQVYTASIGSITPTTPHWYASSGSFSSATSNPSTWTAPNPPLSDGYGTSITLWPDALNTWGLPVYTQNVAVYYPAVATSLGSSSGAYVTNGASVTLTPTFTGGSGHAYIGTTSGGTQVTAAAVSGSGYSATPASNATTTYYLHVQNAAVTNTSTATNSIAITAVAAPAISSFVASTTSPLYGAMGVTITPTFSGGTATIGTTGFGTSDISANATTTTPITVQGSGFVTTKTYYLRVTNLAGTTTDSSVTITPQTVSVGAINSGSLTRVYRTHTIALSATISGASSSNVNWTATGSAGSFSPTTTASGVTTLWTAPVIKGNYTVTATSVDDGTKTSSLVLEVVTGSGKKSTGSSS